MENFFTFLNVAHVKICSPKTIMIPIKRFKTATMMISRQQQVILKKLVGQREFIAFCSLASGPQKFCIVVINRR